MTLRNRLPKDSLSWDLGYSPSVCERNPQIRTRVSGPWQASKWELVLSLVHGASVVKSGSFAPSVLEAVFARLCVESCLRGSKDRSLLCSEIWHLHPWGPWHGRSGPWVFKGSCFACRLGRPRCHQLHGAAGSVWQSAPTAVFLPGSRPRNP